MIFTGIDSSLIVTFLENSIAVKRAICIDGKYAITISAKEVMVSVLGKLVSITIYRASNNLTPFILNLEKGKDFEDILIY